MDTLLQWNIRGLVKKWPEIKNFFSVLAPVLIALQETWFLPTDQYDFRLSNYTLYRLDEVNGERRHGGVALYVNNDYTQSEITLDTELQAVACTVFINGRNIDVCSIYIPPDYDTSQVLRQLNRLVDHFHHPYLLLGDFNAHSPLWWDQQSLDPRGRHLEDFIDMHNLIVLNCNQPTYFHLSHNTHTAIDLSLSSACLGTWFQWHADGDIYDSDHYPIYIRTTFPIPGVSSFTPRWKLDKADWVRFTDICEAQLRDRPDHPIDAISHITETLKAAASQCIPLTKPCRKGLAVPWWSAEVRQAIAKRKRAFRFYLRHRTEHALINRNKERANAQRIIRRAKRNSWQHYLSYFTSSTPISQIWNLIRRLTGKRASTSTSIPVLRFPGRAAALSDPTEVVNKIAQTIADNSSNNKYPAGFIDAARQIFTITADSFHSTHDENYNAPFSLLELKTAIASSGNTSVGPDTLHYTFFRHLSDSSLTHILLTFNDLWEKHLFPESWKEGNIIALPKPGKTRTNPNNYRPIALTSCLAKLLERMVAKRLAYTLETNHLLSKQQNGFRKHHSPMDHLIRLETDIRKGFKHKKHTTVVFLDIKKAYDMVYKPALIYKLHRLGIKGHMGRYLYNFLSGTRRVKVKYRSLFSDIHETENGLPQGSCISPLLFNVFIDDLFDDIPIGLSHSLFADDSAVWCTDNDYDVSISRIQACLSKLESWSRRFGLEFSAEKSAMVIFSRFNNITPARHLCIGNTPIPHVNHFKFLGVVLDRQLNMGKHVKYVKEKCSKRLNLFRCLTSSEICADRPTLLRLYKALVLPIIEYGAVVYASGKESNLKKLEVIQNSFIRVALGAMKTSPIHALQVEANIPPLYIRRKELTLRYFSKIKQYPDHSTYPSLAILPNLHHTYLGPSERRTGLTIASRVKRYSCEFQFNMPEIHHMPTLDVVPWRLHSRTITYLFEGKKSSMSPQEIQQTFALFKTDNDDYQYIYTDGSKAHNKTANAIITEGFADLQGRLPDDTSIFMAELHAIYVALRFVEHYGIPKAYICSDSRSALQSLINPLFKEHLIFQLINLHQKLIENGAQIKFLWVPGHSGITGNERADESAKRALNLPNITPIPTNHHSIRSAIRHSANIYWERNWQNHEKRTHLHDIKLKTNNWSSSSRKNRLEEKALARLRLGHTYLTHSFIFHHGDRPQCELCDTRLTVTHLLLHCRHHVTERRPMSLYCRTHNVPFTLKVLLGDEHPELLELLFTFLRRTNLLERF